VVIPDRVIARAFASLEPLGDCLISDYACNHKGVPIIGWRDEGRARSLAVHRVVWYAAHRSVPVEPLTLHRTCGDVECARLEHLVVMTRAENAATRPNAMR